MASQLDAEEVLAAQQPTPEKTVNGFSPIPQTSKERLQAAAHDKALDVDGLVHGKDGVAATATDAVSSQSQKTILYLAYGSNLSSATFRKTRGIVPLSEVNVFVPDLALTFDLPGLPYLEPCFAATQYRDRGTGKLRYLSSGVKSTSVDEDNDEVENDSTDNEEAVLIQKTKHDEEAETGKSMIWPKPLVGVVYEVTLSDYANIIASEGGGASYVDVVTNCYPFPANYDPTSPVPDHPDTTPFMAHTLLSPPGSNSPSSHLKREPYYAQPSPRYKNLLVTGAAEHDLPVSYRDFLSALPAYRATTARQKVGRVVFAIVWAPFLISTMILMRALADKRGRAPGWLAWLQRSVFEGMWWSYDEVALKVAGEGEKTVE